MGSRRCLAIPAPMGSRRAVLALAFTVRSVTWLRDSARRPGSWRGVRGVWAGGGGTQHFRALRVLGRGHGCEARSLALVQPRRPWAWCDGSHAGGARTAGRAGRRATAGGPPPPKAGCAVGQAECTESGAGGCADRYTMEVRAWVERVVVGWGLCPWAGQAMQQASLRCVTCPEETPDGAVRHILEEASRLCSESTPALSTTLVVCPHVRAWQDFDTFSRCVGAGFGAGDADLNSLEDYLALVAFHPAFLRWQALPPGVGVGSTVQAHWAGPQDGRVFPPPMRLRPATLLDACPEHLGARNLAVQFDGGHKMVLPWEWVLPAAAAGHGQPLPDNAMHRAPHPTVHLLRLADLDAVPEGEGDRVQLRNHLHLAALGSEALEVRPPAS
mmetsp:Transcript_33428/g.105944  ORF Transcript_33428/g.105944 Transcript_33428/m.105944 type:complete len:386 (-) Transcript_33428:89-1246(-)